MVHFAGYTPRFHPSDFHTLSDRRRRCRLADRVRAISSPTTRTSRRSCPWPGSTGPGATLTATRTVAAPDGRQRAGLHTRLPRRRHRSPRRPGRHHQRTLRQPAALHLPWLLPPGLQGQRQGLAPDHAHPGRPRPRRGDPAPTAWSVRIEVDDRRPRHRGRRISTTGVEHRQRARLVVAVAGYSIETPRLLLNSACRRFPDGLCNDFDQVGRYVMVQGAPQTAGRYSEEIRSYKAPPPEASSGGLLRDRPDKDYRRGFSLQCISPLPDRLRRARHRPGTLGRDLPRVHARLRALGDLRRPVRVPPAPENRVTLADETDRHGLARRQLHLLAV